MPELEELKEKPKGKTKYLVIDDEGYGYLPYTDEDGTVSHRLMGAAWASLHGGYRGNQYSGPNGDEAISKLKDVYKSEGLETPEEQHASETLSDVKDGLVRMAVAYTGKYEKDGRPFAISDSDLESIAKNLENREVPIDYEHLSADPSAPPGHSRAAGWIKSPDKIEPFGQGRKILYVWTEFTPSMLMAIRNKEYRYFSPEPHWGEKDEHGKPIGTRLAAGAITNRPFLKDLPPIEIESKDFPALLEAVALSELTRQRLVDVGDVHVPADINTSKKGNRSMKKFTMKKLSKGKHGIFDGDEQVGTMDADELEELAEEMHADELKQLDEFKKCGDVASLKKKMDELEELKKGSGKKMSEADMEELEELRKLKARTQKGGDLYIKHDGDDDDQDGQKSMKKMTEVVKAHNASQGVASDMLCLTEFAKTEQGEKTELLADDMLTRGKLSLIGFRKHQRIEKLVENAIKDGKILPKQRESYYTLAIQDFDTLKTLLSEAKVVVDLKERGIQGTNDGMSAKEELDNQINAYLTEHKDKQYADALSFVANKHPELWTRHKNQSQVLAER